MMALIVVANPSPNSFSHAMAEVARTELTQQGYEISFHDLYAEQFNPVQPVGEAQNTESQDTLVEQHCHDLANADLIVIIHPNWWGQPPAILKGWIDRVFRLNTAYGYAEGDGYDAVPIGLLKAKKAYIFNTSNTPADREQNVFGDPLELIWKKCVFDLCGVTNVHRKMYGSLAGSSEAQRNEWLNEVANSFRY